MYRLYSPLIKFGPIIATVAVLLFLGTGVEASGIIETCPGDASRIPGEEGCRDINILLLQVIRIGEFLFQIIGTVAFVFFIYGGFSLILSLGNAEKAKKAHATLFAAAVGVLIAFSAFILVDFVLEALDVNERFRGI